MRNTFTRKGLVLAAAVLSIVAVLASPASADPTLAGNITVGSEVFTIPGPVSNCPGSQTLPITFSGSATGGTWDASNGFFKSPFQLAGNPQKYQAEIDFLPTSVGTYTRTAVGPPATYALAGRFDVRAVLQTLTKNGTNPETCTKTNVCTVQARLILGATSSHTGTLPVPSTGDTSTIDSSTANPGGVNTFAVGGACPVTLSNALVAKIASTAVTLTWP